MLNRRLISWLLALYLAASACQFGMPTPATQIGPTATTSTDSRPPTGMPTADGRPPTAAPTSEPPTQEPTQSQAPVQGLPPFTVSYTGFNTQPPMNWQPAAYAGKDYSLPLSLSEVANSPVMGGLTPEQKDFLQKNGFVVIQSQEPQFADIRNSTGKYYGQPYFLTTDAAFHAMHLTFDELLKAFEQQQLRPRMVAITQAALKEVFSYLPQVKGTPIEGDTQLAAAYLSVALKLFDPGATIDERVAKQVNAQVEQIMAGGGKGDSVLISGFEDDYGAYQPVGHYAGKPLLEQYFRGMAWFGRVNFKLKSEDPHFVPSRVPLIITLALRKASVDGPAASDVWASVHSLLSFLVGPSDDGGPVEYAQLMDQIYGPGVTLQDLADESRWQQFLQNSDQIPAPQINSTFVAFSSQLESERGWRFMGQRFTFDGYLLQNLVYDHVGTYTNQRKLPSGLDVMAALGSLPAWQALEASGETAYQNYPEQMKKLKEQVKAQTETKWLSTAYSAWLYSFFPALEAKTQDYPGFMRTPAWGYKELNSSLGSWAELKHDTVLYSKMPEFYGGGGPPSSGPAPAWVEPNPPVFYRMAYLARSLGDGLLSWVDSNPGEAPSPDDFTYPDGLPRFLEKIGGFSGQLEEFGEIAAKELSGQPLTSDDFGTIQDCLGPVECQVEYMQEMNKLTSGQAPTMEMPPVPVVAAVAGAEDKVLEAGVGALDRIYVVISVEGKPQIAQGGVFSYFEFPQDRSNRLTDQQWREQLSTARRPAWAANFSLPGGKPASYLAFRVNDWYKITEAGDKLNVRAIPGTGADVIAQLKTGDYTQIVDGPVQASGFTWWKIHSDYSANGPVDGWAVENQEWYERAWGQ